MDKIWYRNPSKSEVIGCCGEMKKLEGPRRTDKSWTLIFLIKTDVWQHAVSMVYITIVLFLPCFYQGCLTNIYVYLDCFVLHVISSIYLVPVPAFWQPFILLLVCVLLGNPLHVAVWFLPEFVLRQPWTSIQESCILIETSYIWTCLVSTSNVQMHLPYLAGPDYTKDTGP